MGGEGKSVGDFGRELSSEAVSMAGVWFYNVMFNWKVSGEWLLAGGKQFQCTYRGKTFNILSKLFMIVIFVGIKWSHTPSLKAFPVSNLFVFFTWTLPLESTILVTLTFYFSQGNSLWIPTPISLVHLYKSELALMHLLFFCCRKDPSIIIGSLVEFLWYLASNVGNTISNIFTKSTFPLAFGKRVIKYHKTWIFLLGP